MDIEGIYPKELHFKLELSETELNFLLESFRSTVKLE